MYMYIGCRGRIAFLCLGLAFSLNALRKFSFEDLTPLSVLFLHWAKLCQKIAHLYDQLCSCGVCMIC